MSRSRYTKDTSPPALTRADVDRLIHDKSTSARIDIVRKVSGMYDPGALNESEQLLAEQIFRLLVRDSAEKIRESLADSLKENPHIPKDIILALANDVESVASPVLSMSEVLSDADIMNIIHHTGDVWRYLAISSRPAISEEVSGALVETRQQEVINSLLDNKGAAFSAESYEKIADIAQENQEMAEKLADRPSLPVAVVEKLMNAVSEGIAIKLSRDYNIDREQLESGTHHALEQTTLELIAIQNDRAQTAQLVGQLYHTDRLTASLIINALCHGNLDFFELSLAMLAQIPPENAGLLISDRGNLGFRAIYDKSGLPMSMLDAVRLLLRAVRRTLSDGVNPGSASFSSHVITHMITLAKEHPVENFSYMLALIRQNAKIAA